MGASRLLPLFHSFHPRRSRFPLLGSLPLRSRPGPFFPGMDKTSIPVHSVPRVLDSDLGLPTPVKAEVLDRLLEGYDATIRDTLVKGFLVGFDLGFRGTPSSNFNVKNLASTGEVPDLVDKALEKEVAAGRMLGPLEVLPFSDFQINPIGLVPKKTPGEYRMISNLSSPKGGSVNDGIAEEFIHVSYSSLEDAIRSICRCGPSPFLAKLDIKHAFRLIPIRPSQYHLLCMRWRNKFFVDRCLPMGARSSAFIFEMFSSAIHFIAKRAGIEWLIHYLDDFLLIARSRSQSLEFMNLFIGLLNVLGVPIAVEKTLGPLQCLEFLGYIIDILNAQIRLPQDKLQRCRDLIKAMLDKKRCRIRQIQSLAGLLQFACGVVVPGRAFLVRLYNLICGRSNPNYSVPLNREVKKDLQLWLTFLNEFNGVSLYKEQLFLSPQVLHIYTDASKSLGCGGVFGKHWFSVPWPSEWWSLQNITFLELVPIFLAVQAWGHLLRDKYVVLHTDNQALSFCINKKTSKEALVMHIIRKIVLLELTSNIMSKAKHVPGFLNGMSDALSRLKIGQFKFLHPQADDNPTSVCSLQELLP